MISKIKPKPKPKTHIAWKYLSPIAQAQLARYRPEQAEKARRLADEREKRNGH